MTYITIRKTDTVGPSRISIQKSSAIGARLISVPITGSASTGSAGVSARYWQLRMTATNTDDAGDTFYLEITAAELRLTPFGTNVALSTNVPAVTATGTNTQTGAPVNAIDGNNSTYWQAEDGQASPGGKSDLVIDLKASYAIQQLAIRNGPIGGPPSFAGRAPTTVEIFTSPDGLTYTSVATWTPAAWTTLQQTQTFTLP